MYLLLFSVFYGKTDTNLLNGLFLLARYHRYCINWKPYLLLQP